MFKRLAAFAVAAVAVTVTPAAAGAAPGGMNPARACQENFMDVRDFLPTMGGCVSSLASVGAEGLLAGEFPSRAAAIHNCKALEASDFLAGKPEGARPYPYAFYGNVGNPLYTAENRAGCVEVLYRLHTGQIPPGFQG